MAGVGLSVLRGDGCDVDVDVDVKGDSTGGVYGLVWTYPITRCPSWNRVTLDPSWTIVPAMSVPKMYG